MCLSERESFRDNVAFRMKLGTVTFGLLFTGLVGFLVGLSGQESRRALSQGARESLETLEKLVDKPKSSPEASFDPRLARVPVGKAHQRGPTDALVTVVEFADFQCPFSGRAQATLGRLMERHRGDVRILFRHRPQPFHSDAELAARVALAADAQQAFWPIHDHFFEHQDALGAKELVAHARSQGLKLPKLLQFLEEKGGDEALLADRALGDRLEVQRTPTFFVNGVRLDAPTQAQLEALVKRALGEARQMVADGIPRSRLYEKIQLRASLQALGYPVTSKEKKRARIPIVDGVPWRGASEPWVTVHLFSEYGGACQAVTKALDTVLGTHQERVQVRFRQHPLTFHPRAMEAAKAVLASHRQEKFWPMHERMCAMDELQENELVGHARALGLDMDRFSKDRASSGVAFALTRDREDAIRYGARGPPTVFVNGLRVEAPLSRESLEAHIERELAMVQQLLDEGADRKNIYDDIGRRYEMGP